MASVQSRDLTPGTHLFNGGVVREARTTGNTTHLTFTTGGTWTGPANHQWIATTPDPEWDADLRIALATPAEVDEAARA